MKCGVILILFLLARATSASAECSWVLWSPRPTLPRLPPRHRGPAWAEGEVNTAVATWAAAHHRSFRSRYCLIWCGSE